MYWIGDVAVTALKCVWKVHPGVSYFDFYGLLLQLAPAQGIARPPA